MRSEHETALVQQLMERLNSQVGVPTSSDLEEIEELLGAIEDIPLSENELRMIHKKCREIYSRSDAARFALEVGRRLAGARIAAGFHAREIAERFRLTEGELRLIESGEQSLSFLEAAKLAGLYDISLDGLVDGLR